MRERATKVSKLGLACVAVAGSVSLASLDAHSAPSATAPSATAPNAPAPGAPSPTPPAVAEAPAPAVEVIFTGFARRVDKGVAIFVRMTGEVPVVVEQSGRRVIYRLSGAKLGVRNNANPLPTGQFGPPVSNVALVPGANSVDVVIDLTNDPGDKPPTYRVVSQSGISTLLVELPPAVAQ
jgi:AMIN domain-containing protein